MGTFEEDSTFSSFMDELKSDDPPRGLEVKLFDECDQKFLGSRWILASEFEAKRKRIMARCGVLRINLVRVLYLRLVRGLIRKRHVRQTL